MIPNCLQNSKLSLENKILLYKTIIKPTWTYGVEFGDAPANPIFA
jgi:hypothetical protein